jgi:hypothetical protein
MTEKSDARTLADVVNRMQGLAVLYSTAGSAGATGIAAIYMGSDCDSIMCQQRRSTCLAGPHQIYDMLLRIRAADVTIAGYYQAGAIACQTSGCGIDLIPVQPV